MAPPSQIIKISNAVWEIPRNYKTGMRVPARIFATEKLLNQMDEGVFEQICNVAMLPGIVKYAMCMPDGHWGYGFPIGGVAPIDSQDGVISPGGIGFDINCGMRLIITNFTHKEIEPYLQKIVDRLFHSVPSGVGGHGVIKFNRKQFEQILLTGAAFCVKEGFGVQKDLDRTEERGCISGADPQKVSGRAIERGINQIGTLGSGNHYLEIQIAGVNNVYDKTLARVYGINREEQVAIMFHCGSRGFGHQIATDYLQTFLRVMSSKYGIHLPDRELACAPFNSPEGQDYFAAMKCAINMSFANRQMILYHIRQAFSEVIGKSASEMQINQIYDVAHNTAKLETHIVDGFPRKLIMHRKGSTRAFGPQMEGLPEEYKPFGQPVIIGGSMESESYLLTGVTSGSASFYSTTHGSGRVMSRRAARRMFRGKEIQKNMALHGIYTRTVSYSGFAEEAGPAYKNIDEVIEAASEAGTCRPVVRFTPIGNIKG